MAITLIATLDGVDSNSYVTVAEADTYFSMRLHSKAWEDITDEEIKKKSLITATKRIDQEKYYGTRTTTTQALAFSRQGLDYLDGVDLNGIIPIQIKEAVYELAIYNINNDMNKFDVDADAVKRYGVKVGSIEEDTEYSESKSRNYNQLPDTVTILIDDLSVSVSGSGQVGVSR